MDYTKNPEWEISTGSQVESIDSATKNMGAFVCMSKGQP